ncbi:Cdc6-like protein, partial [Spraguea lophii 42_110]
LPIYFIILPIMKIIYGREEEQKILLTYINNFIKDNQSLSLYICGVPGSGKTYTLLNTLEEYTNNNNDCDNKNNCNKGKNKSAKRNLNKSNKNKSAKNKCNSNDNNINVTYINCTSLRSKKLIFKKIYYEITKCNIKDNQYEGIIEHIEKCNNKHIIVIDEVDLLINKNYEILYNLFDIPLIVNNKDNENNENGDCVSDKNVSSSNKGNKTVKRKNNKTINNKSNTTNNKTINKININKNIMLIVIANNLPEKDGKVSSRLGTNRIYFKPYSVQQLVKIFNLQSDDPFILACKRISAINGDIRKLLHLKEIMKNNTTLQQHNDKGDNRDSKDDNKYKMIDKKMKDIYTPLYLFFLKSLTFNQKNIIKILCNHRRISQLKLFDEYKIILRINNNGNNYDDGNTNDNTNDDINIATNNTTPITNNITTTVIVDKKLSDIYNIFIMNLRM